MSSANPVPVGYNTVTAYLIVKDAKRALEFYRKAFNAEEVLCLPGPSGQGVLHAEMRIGKSIVMLSDESVGSTSARSPESLGATSVTMHLYVDDVDTLFHQAVASGCKIAMPLYDAFWGDRYGKVSDPFGHEWSMSTRVRSLSNEQLARAADEYMNQPSA